MKFENPDLPEGINVSYEHPLKEFAQLVLGIVVMMVILLFVLHFSAQYLVKFIPFRYELAITDKVEFLETQKLSVQAKIQQEGLQGLADQLSKSMQLPDGIEITVHYSDQELVNAFATLGGHVFVYQGLLDQLNSEQALAMVLAHEIAHIKLRHPISSLSKSLTLIAFGGLITGVTGSSAGDMLINSSTSLGLLTFSRQQERQADLLAAGAIQAYYGNIEGAKDLFSTFESLQRNDVRMPVIFTSHPHSDMRWNTLIDNAPKNGWAVDGQLSEIPIEIKGVSAYNN